MRLPNETLLDIISFVDHASLVALSFANTPIHSIIESYADQLARRRTFQLKLSDRHVTVKEQVEGQWNLLVNEICSLANYNEVLREIEATLRGHPIVLLELRRPLSIPELLELLPQLAYTETLSMARFDTRKDMQRLVDDYIRPFSHLEALRLGLVLVGFPSRILEALGECMALRVPSVTIRVSNFPAIDDAIEDSFYRFCFDFSRLAPDDKRFVDVSGAYFSDNFCRRVVKGVENSPLPVTVKFECVLGAQVVTDAIVDYFDEAVRYVSRRSDLIVVYARPSVTVTNVHEDAQEALKGY